jgi:hypothetical protein
LVYCAGHLLDPVVRRHASISHTAFLAVCIIVLWRSNERFVFFKPLIIIFSIAFPFRTCGPISISQYSFTSSVCHSTAGIIDSARAVILHFTFSMISRMILK